MNNSADRALATTAQGSRRAGNPGLCSTTPLAYDRQNDGAIQLISTNPPGSSRSSIVESSALSSYELECSNQVSAERQGDRVGAIGGPKLLEAAAQTQLDRFD